MYLAQPVAMHLQHGVVKVGLDRRLVSVAHVVFQEQVREPWQRPCRRTRCRL
jgi:hypothetical protein